MVLATPGAQAQTSNSAQLTKLLGQMDAASAKFRSAQADFSWDQLTVVVQEHDVQKGSIAFQRGPKGTAMVAHVLTEDGQPAPKDVLFKGGQLQLYQPSIKQETVLEAGKNRSSFESYATLGFGGSGKDLSANWNVTYEGTDTVDGTAVTKLDLKPKDPKPTDLFTHIEIWIDPATATSRKQVAYTSSGDTRTALYTNIKLNDVPESAFTLKVPGGTQIIHK
jgi:outer membrane lipoprotein-sorting protein